MLSKAQNKYIRSLSQQKYREEYGVFVVEGDKIALEWLRSTHKIKIILALGDWLEENDRFVKRHPEAEIIVAEEHHLESVTNLQTPNKVLLVVETPENTVPVVAYNWSIVLDDIQDPGNMGTIIRIADWFGVKNVIASNNSVDFYNPKVVQAAMGGHLRVSLYTDDIISFIKKANVPVYAAVLDGDDIYSIHNAPKGIILIGNESKGISGSLQELATHKITIPRRGGAESLNAAVSTGIICALLTKL
jgi:TrmH family RNA methyltransferase